MAGNAAKPVLVEYDVQRPLIRLFFGFLEAMVFVGYQHGYTTRLPITLGSCSGGWTEGIEFLASFGVLAIFIEWIHWIGWRILHRKEILPFEEEQRLFGKATTLGVRNRRLESRGILELFGPPLPVTEATSTPSPPGPQDYDLVESGGRLPLVPRSPLLGLIFSIGLIALVLVLHVPGSLDSCAPTSLSWPDLFGRLIFAYAFLALGSLAEFRIVATNRPSSPAM